MIFYIIILVVSFLLDGILTNFLPYMINDLSLLTPLFTLISIISLYPLFKKQEKKYYILCFSIGILYDLFYTNLLFTNSIVFLFIGLIVKFIYSKLDINFVTNSFLILFIITIYQIVFALLLFIFNVVPINFKLIYYLITHSLLINIVYGQVLYLICRKIPFERHFN